MEPAAPAPAHPRIKSGMPVFVIGGALLRIAQGLISFTNLLEILLGSFVAGILVRVIFDRQLAVGLLDFLIGSGPLQTENLVIVAFGHLSQQ